MFQNRKGIVFVALAYALSWLGWAPLWLESLDAVHMKPSAYWHLAGSFGPLVAELVVSASDHQ